MLAQVQTATPLPAYVGTGLALPGVAVYANKGAASSAPTKNYQPT